MSMTQYQVYSTRWTVLGLFCLATLCNSALWVTFAPISDLTGIYIGGPTGDVAAVNLLATSYLILYLPGTILAAWENKSRGLRPAVLLGISLTAFGSLIRMFGALFRDQLSSGGVYTLFLIGQCCAALGQPVFVNSPALLASLWFPVSERDIATTVASMFNPIGAAVGQVLPALLVSKDESDGTVHGMTNLLGLETGLCGAALLVVVVLFRSAPPSPPSPSAELRLSSARTSDDSEGSSAVKKLKNDLKLLWHNGPYLLLLVCFSVGLGLFNALLTLIFQIVQPYGYSNDDAGNFGAVLIVSGLIGAGIAGALMEKYKAYEFFLKCCVGLCLVATAFLVGMLRTENLSLLLVAFGLLGLPMLPLLPITMETCAECTYPVSEDVSVGILVLGLIFLLQSIAGLPTLGSTTIDPAGITILGLVGIICLGLSFFRVSSRRAVLEQGQSLLSGADGDGPPEDWQYLSTGHQSLATRLAQVDAYDSASASDSATVRTHSAAHSAAISVQSRPGDSVTHTHRRYLSAINATQPAHPDPEKRHHSKE